MKAIRASMLMGASAILATSVAWGAGPGGQPGQRADRGGRAAHSLGLTDAQKAKIQPIMEKYRGRFRTLSEQQRTERARLREKMQAEIAPLLTPEQREKVAKTREHRGQRLGQRGARQGHRFYGRPGAWHGRHFGRRHPGSRPAPRRLSQHLQLAPEQQQKLQEISGAHRAAMRSIMQDARSGKLDRGQARNRVEALRKEMRANVAAVLTPDQQQKLETLRQQKRGRWHRG